MKHLQTTIIQSQQIVAITCDICKTTFELKSTKLDLAEFIHISHEFGYGSKFFSDGAKLEMDICEECMFTIVKSNNIKLKKESMYE